MYTYYQKYWGTVSEFSSAYDRLFSSLNDINLDVQTKNTKSEFAPFALDSNIHSNELILVLPRFNFNQVPKDHPPSISVTGGQLIWKTQNRVRGIQQEQNSHDDAKNK